MFVHARFGMSALLCLLASSTAIVDDTRWQVVNAHRIKVGHAQITRTESASAIVDDGRLELRLGKTGRRVRYRIHVATESAPDDSLRRLLREVQTSEGDPRIEARVVGDDLEITRGAGAARTTEKMAGAALRYRRDSDHRKRGTARIRAAGRTAFGRIMSVGTHRADNSHDESRVPAARLRGLYRMHHWPIASAAQRPLT